MVSISFEPHPTSFSRPSLSVVIFLLLVARSELQHTKTNNTAEVMSHIGMNDVPSYIEFTPCDFDSDIERDPPSCAEDSSFCDDTSRFAEQKIEVIKPSQQDVDAPYHNKMPAHMTSHPDDESQQDLDAMDWMVHNSIRRQDWLHRKVSPSIIEHDNKKLIGNFEQQDLDVSASDLQQMILDIRCSSPHEFVNQCTLSLSRATNKLVADAGDVDTHASPGVSGSPMTSYNVSQPRQFLQGRIPRRNKSARA